MFLQFSWHSASPQRAGGFSSRPAPAAAPPVHQTQLAQPSKLRAWHEQKNPQSSGITTLSCS